MFLDKYSLCVWMEEVKYPEGREVYICTTQSTLGLSLPNHDCNGRTPHVTLPFILEKLATPLFARPTHFRQRAETSRLPSIVLIEWSRERDRRTFF
jgi:hypothetical protein